MHLQEWHGAQAVCFQVGTGEDTYHAGRGTRRRDVNACYSGVRMRRARERNVRLTGKADVVRELARAG
jgi:hypothetical protein